VSRELVIERSRGWRALGLNELWAYRELVYFFVWRDLKLYYRQAALGAAWAVLQPLLTMVVFTFFFSRLAGIEADGGAPYPVFSFAGLLPWTFFAASLSRTAGSVVGSSSLLQKVYFPRLVLPLAGALAPLVDLGIAGLVLGGLMVAFGVAPGWAALALPAWLLLAVVAALGPGLWLAALNVRYRDVRFVVPFGLQLLLFVSPVIYPASLVLRELEELGLPAWLYGLNPMVSVLEGVRWGLLQGPPPPIPVLVASLSVALTLLVSGAFFFRRQERLFADIA
jgi:homopolymeric O-antigen transport system permease protein